MDDVVIAGADLQAGLERHIPPWVERRVVELVVAWRGRADQAALEAAETAGRAVADLALPMLRRVLLSRPAERTSSPLDTLRRSLGPATATLAELGVPPVVRDGFAEQRFPDDVYDLAPAAFADIHPELHEPGIVWGAATAHRHLRARATERAGPRDAETDRTAGPVLAYAPDLMDRSRLSAAGDVEVVRHLDELVEAGAAARLVIVDLDRPGVVEALADIDAPVVAFHPHEDDELRDRALAAGCRDVLTRAQFFRRLPQLLAEV